MGLTYHCMLHTLPLQLQGPELREWYLLAN